MTINRSAITRRHALSGAATAGLAVPLLAACGDDGGESSAADPTSSATSPSATRTGKSTRSGSAETTAAAPAGEGTPVADVPVGGGIVLTDPRVVITQPSEGEFHAFTAICTHANCPVARVTSQIECDCHGSRFSIEDGSVTGGPAPTPLAAVDFTVAGDRVVLS